MHNLYNDDNKIINNTAPDTVNLILSMSCDVFWKYEFPVTIDRRQFSRKYTNRTEEEAFRSLSQFLCNHMKMHIQDCLINDGNRDQLPILEKVFPKFHIHSLTSHEILYPKDPSNSDHCRGDSKIFICTHC
jgi:hypothetical protein